MKLALACMRCAQPNLDADPVVYPAVLLDDGFYRFTCASGHETITLLQEEKFEILFELALNAIVDGYFREAVASFTASLERFYEFYIRVVASKRKISNDALAQSWSAIKNQSERQLGAYILLYTLEMGRAPLLLSNTKIELRNRVVHKGHIPTATIAVEYGQSVLDVVVPVRAELKAQYGDVLQTVSLENMQNIRKQLKKGENPSSMTYPTLVGMNRTYGDPHPTVNEWLQSLTKRREQRGW